jgi:hypothetical protein
LLSALPARRAMKKLFALLAPLPALLNFEEERSVFIRGGSKSSQNAKMSFFAPLRLCVTLFSGNFP